MPRKKKYKWLKGCERRRYKSRQELFDIAKGNTDFATDAFIKAYEKEEEYNIAMAEKKRQEEEENFRKLASVDYRRDIYFQVNNLSEIDKLKAYIVTFKEHPNLLYVAFSLNREKAEAEAQRYMRDVYYSMYSITDCPISLKEAHGLRAKNLDKYKTTGKIPIPELMKEGLTFPCCGCGKYNFDLVDYETKRCFIVEGEGDLNPYTNGSVFCYNCYKKYFC